MANILCTPLSVATILSLLSAVLCKDLIRLSDEFKKLEGQIVDFIQTPTNEGWEDNLLDMSFYVRSLQSIIRELDGGITLGTFREAEKVMINGKPNFIDKLIDDEKFIMELKITDEQLQRLYYMQKFAGIEWEDFCHNVLHRKQMSNILL